MAAISSLFVYAGASYVQDLFYALHPPFLSQWFPFLYQGYAGYFFFRFATPRYRQYHIHSDTYQQTNRLCSLTAVLSFLSSSLYSIIPIDWLH